MDRIYRTVNIKDQETQHYYSHRIQHDARQHCPALIVLKDNNNNMTQFLGNGDGSFPVKSYRRAFARCVSTGGVYFFRHFFGHY